MVKSLWMGEFWKLNVHNHTKILYHILKSKHEISQCQNSPKIPIQKAENCILEHTTGPRSLKQAHYSHPILGLFRIKPVLMRGFCNPLVPVPHKP